MEKEIKEEIRKWSTEVLERSSKHFNGLPPCPYARRAFATKCVSIHVTDNLQTALDIKRQNPPRGQRVEVVAWTGYEKMTSDEFDEWLDKTNDPHEGTWVIGFHPDHPDDEAMEEFEGNGAPEYALILVQEYKHLVNASKQLFKRGYYGNYSQEDKDYIKWRNNQ